MYRIATFNAYSQVVSTLQQRQQDLTNAQEQLSSGKRVLHASDDPVAAARAERARALQQSTKADTRASDAAKNAMTLTESTLGDAGDLLQQARELVVSAGNATYSASQRQDVANQLTQIRNQLLGVANRTDGSGHYVFSGQGTTQAPFIDAPGGVQYTGTGGQLQVATDEPLPLTLDGRSVWMSGRTGNGVFQTANTNSSTAWIDGGQVTDPSQITGDSYQVVFGSGSTYSITRNGQPTAVTNASFSSGQAISVDGMSFTITGAPASGDTFDITPSQPSQSVFGALDKVIGALKNGNATTSQVTQAVQTGLTDIDGVAGQIQSARSFAGETLNRIDGVQSRLSSLQAYAQTTQSDAEDLDEVQAISAFQSKQTGYQVALQTYASLQKMSFFQYINS